MRCGSHLGSEPPLVPPCQTTSSNLAHSETPAIDKSLGGFFPSTTSVIERISGTKYLAVRVLLQVIHAGENRARKLRLIKYLGGFCYIST